MFCNYSNFVLGVTVSIWTVVQTSFHIIWVLCGYYLYICKLKPSHYWLVIVHLTYFYKNDCGDIELGDRNIFSVRKDKKNVYLATNNSTQQDIYHIVQTILEKATFPKESNAAWRTHLYFYTFLICDAVWIISAFLLFAGTCFHIKKCLSLLFYCPWLITTALVTLLDVTSAVHFGLDILQIHSFSTWLKFIGVENYNDFTNFNSHDLSDTVPTLPTTTLCLLFSRFLIFWILNIVNFFQIMQIAVLAYQDNLQERNQRYQRRGRSLKGGSPRGQGTNMNSSESRIRSWQLFYGAIETTSTASSASSKTSERDCNSSKSTGGRSSRMSAGVSKDPNFSLTYTLTRASQNHESLDSYDKYISSIREGTSTNRSDEGPFYHGYPDVAACLDGTDKSDVVESRKSQLPWSYFPTPEDVQSKGSQSSILHLNTMNRYGVTSEDLLKRNVTNTQM